jgi:hypothetical protein
MQPLSHLLFDNHRVNSWVKLRRSQQEILNGAIPEKHGSEGKQWRPLLLGSSAMA